MNKTKCYKTQTVEDTELVYSLLKEKYPDRQIEIEFNDNTKEYTLMLTDKKFKQDPEIPVDLKIKVIYGDSVTSDTPLLLMKEGQVYIKTISSIFDESKMYEYPGFKMFDQTIRLEKQYSTTDYQVWTDKGWVNIKKVIRHKTDKKIYRVLTHTGCVDVTEDHSLINENYEMVKPGELKIGDTLLHSFPTEFPENEQTVVKMEKRIEKTKKCNTCNIEKDISKLHTVKDGYNNKCKECNYYKKAQHPLRNIMKNFKYEDYFLTEKEAEVWGFFMGDGSCGSYNCKSGIKNSWVLNNQDLNRLNYYKDILEEIEPVKFKILDTLKSSGVYKLVPVGSCFIQARTESGSIKYMVDKYRPLFYDTFDCNADGDKYKIIPNCILNASVSIKKAFFKGYYEADGCKTRKNNCTLNSSFAIKGKIAAQCLYYLTRSLGFDMGINITSHPKKGEIYFLSKTTFKNKKETIVKKIVEKRKITTSEFVYDLETELGRFGCGLGQLEAINTDSIFISIKYNRDDYELNRKDTFKLASICGENLTHEVFKRPPIEMEFEKVFHPFILLSKKRYIGRKYDNMKNPFEMTKLVTSGIALTRRDYCKMVKKCYKEIIDVIMEMKENDSNVVNKGIDIFKRYISNIMSYNIEFDDLIVSALLAKSYKTRPVHLILADKLKERKEEVQIGSRIPYIYIECDDKTKIKSELGEDPEYAKKHNLKFNRLCYLEQLAKPVLSFFCIILKDSEDKCDELIEYVNSKIANLGGKKLKNSDFKVFSDE